MSIRLRGLMAVLVTAVLGALLPAGAAHAEGRTVQGGRLDWGIKTSFQRYITGPVAKGGYSLTGGAATVGGSGFRFHSAAGSYDSATGAFRASFSGGVRFVGHRSASGAYALDMTLTRPTVTINGSSGMLYVDITSKDKGSGAITTASQVPFASLSPGGIDMRGGGTSVALNNLPATLTSQGAGRFSGYYSAGTALDPVSLAVDVKPAAAKPESPEEKTEKTKKDGTAGEKAGKSGSSEKLADGAVDWGVRRTFREYVTGEIGRGKWTLTEGALDGGALFRFPDGKGAYRKGELAASFDGAVHFTGENGLDLRLGRVRVTVKDGKGTLYADVKSPQHTGKKVALVTFAAKDLKARKGLATVTEAPAKLTADGAEAFGGMYPRGAAMDPVSLAVALTEDAELPALPDLGSAPAASEAASAEASAPAEPVTESTKDDDGGLPVLPLSIAAGTLAVLAAAAVFLLRKRRAPRPAAETPQD